MTQTVPRPTPPAEAPQRHGARAAASARSAARAQAATPDADGAFTHRQILTILGGLLLGMFLAALDQTVVSTAIRTIADDLQGYDLQAWATTAFLITSTISTPLYGKLSDMYGRRPFFLAAIAIFIVGSALCGISTSMYELAGFRALQGIGAGGLMSLALAILADIVPPRERSKYQGYFMAVFGTSSVLGPVIGGFFAGQGSILGLTGWRWIFWVNVPLGVLALVVVARVLHLPHQRRDHAVDWRGAVSLVVFLVPLLIVAEQGRTWGWGSAQALVSYVVAAVGFVAFVLSERKVGEDALLPLTMFRNRTFAVSGLGSIVVGMGMFGGLLLLPQYLQIVRGRTPTEAGLQMIPLVLGIMTGAMSSGIAISKTGRYKWFPVVGTVLLTTGLAMMSLVIGADTAYWTLVPFMLLMGLGLGFNFQPVILAVQNAVDPRQMGVATSSVTFFRQMGGTLGTAIFLSILFTRLPGDIGSAVQDAAQQNPSLAPQLQAAGGSGTLEDTSFIQQLPAAVAAPFKEGFSTSLDMVFLVAASVVALGFVIMLFLPQLELRQQSGIQARAGADGGAAGAAGADGDQPQGAHGGEEEQAPPAAQPDGSAVRAGRHSSPAAREGVYRGRHAGVLEAEPDPALEGDQQEEPAPDAAEAAIRAAGAHGTGMHGTTAPEPSRTHG